MQRAHSLSITGDSPVDLAVQVSGLHAFRFSAC